MKSGRKDKYESHVKPFLDRIPLWRKDGLTEEQIANKLGIDEATLYRYKNKFCEFCEALKKGKENLLEELKETLYRRAMGYKVEEVKHIIRKTKKGNDVQEVEKYTKEVHSDTCLIFALKNLDPENWRDRRELQQDIKLNKPVIIVDDIPNIVIEGDEGDEIN
jgi:transcriptional regulator with XRE-family HTH domain